MDNYGDFGRDGKYDTEAGFEKAPYCLGLCRKTGKLAAFSRNRASKAFPIQFGGRRYFSKRLNPKKLNLAYVLVWRNDAKSPTHYYAPFPGQISTPDFVKFYNDSYTLFGEEFEGGV